MSEKPRYEADELLAVAKMEGCPVIIVEGNDDISIYENILSLINKECDVFASENLKNISNRIFSMLNELNWVDENVFIGSGMNMKLKDFQYQYKKFNKNIKGKEGCNGVINALKEIEYVAKGSDYSNDILGIIDRDARLYRNEIETNLKGLFILKYYSIESHFIHQNVIATTIDFITLKSKKSLNIQISSNIYNTIIGNISTYYYLSLDCLKNACDINYTSCFSYSPDSINSHIKHQDYQTKLQTVMTRKNQLDEFASDFSLNNSIDNMLLIMKGKWILDLFRAPLKISQYS